MTIAPHESLSLFVDYDLQLGVRQTFHVASASVQLTW